MSTRDWIAWASAALLIPCVTEPSHAAPAVLKQRRTGLRRLRSSSPAGSQRELCPKLGVDPRLCCILDAWVHLRQYLAHSDERTLQRTRRLLERQATIQASVGAPTSVPGRPAQSELVLSAMREHLLRCVCDAFLHYTPEQLPAILNVTRFAADVSDAEPWQREVLVASIDAELERGWLSSRSSTASPSAPSGEEAQGAADAGLPSTAVGIFVRWFQVCAVFCMDMAETAPPPVAASTYMSNMCS